MRPGKRARVRSQAMSTANGRLKATLRRATSRLRRRASSSAELGTVAQPSVTNNPAAPSTNTITPTAVVAARSGLRFRITRASTRSEVASRYAHTNGRTVCAGTWASSVAPSIPPRTPGSRSEKNIRRSMLRNRAWEALETPAVTVSAACTVALVMAGGTPGSGDQTRLERNGAMLGRPGHVCGEALLLEPLAIEEARLVPRPAVAEHRHDG